MVIREIVDRGMFVFSASSLRHMPSFWAISPMHIIYCSGNSVLIPCRSYKASKKFFSGFVSFVTIILMSLLLCVAFAAFFESRRRRKYYLNIWQVNNCFALIFLN